ncbi:unnamed protein product [Adineta steineri]|uniref:GDP-D-glucose phosphorylase 1 n=1 Tax=Adineta steineri TaxID=433720 RepID=A0A813UGI3_9BILA|nr:unnamed protein product [Adineta steineri]CAF0868891.1 unnamed protein product [Adineta steineri]
MWKHFKFDPHSINLSCHTDVKLNEFDALLHTEWDRALAQNLFTFQIDNQVKQRVLDGDLHYIVELNPSRYEKRRLPYAFEHVITPFDKNKFNFNKIKNEEILFSLDNEQQTDKHLVIINNSPIRSYHVLLVPDRQLEQTQISTIDSILFALEFITSSAHPFIYVGFNSLCGYASINHLHFHGIYMPDRLFLQTIVCSPFHTKSNCYLHDFFQTEAFAFEIKNVNDFDKVARYVYKITNYLTQSEIAHNLSIVKGDSFSVVSEPALRIFIWFRQPKIGVKPMDRCNFACLELSGYVFLRYAEVFDDLTELELRENINGIALSSELRIKIKEDIKHLLDQ